MKTSFLLAILVLTFNLAGHAQYQRWSLELSGPFDTLTNSGVYSDGVGGGVILFGPAGGTTFTRAVWFNASGTLLLTNSYGLDQLAVLRVRPQSLDLQGTYTPSGSPIVLVHHFVATPGGSKNPRSLQLRGEGIESASYERVASFATTQPDKRGFFTVQSSATNFFVRRFNF